MIHRLALSVLLVFGLGSVALAQQYVGDTTCSVCHPDKYDTYISSGHPWKLHQTGGQVPASDTWPHTPVPPLPTVNGQQLEWSAVEYVIGNYFWKARFIDPDGFIWTGGQNDATQWNIATQEFVPYHPGEEHPYNCGRCHTTGYDPNGNQNGLPGLIGTWFQDGVRCEACHGPGSDHVAAFGQTPPPGGKDCADCHYRDADFRMPWKGGFMRHHQQAEDLSHSPHKFMACTDCHDPHKSVVYEEGGTITQCTDCHPGSAANNFYVVQGMENVECTDCHMPKMGKSAAAENPYKADIHGHLFRIMTDPIAAADNTYQVDSTTFWNQDANGDAFITLDYACLQCHQDMTLEEAASHAQGIHTPQQAGNVWTVNIPYLQASFTLTIEEFGHILLITEDFPDGTSLFGVGMQSGGIIFWFDVEGAMFYGLIDQPPGTMQGIVINFFGSSSIFFAEKQ